MIRWKSHVLLAAGAVPAFFGARALSSSTSSSGGKDAPTASASKAFSAAKAVPEDPAGAIAWAQSASLTDCEALLAAHQLEDLNPLLREALFLRLSALDPGRLADLLLAAPLQFIPSWPQWIKWLVLAHPDLLKTKMEAMSSLSPRARQNLENVINAAEFEKQNDPRKILEEALEKGGHEGFGGAFFKLAASDPHLALDYMELLMNAGLLPGFFDAGNMMKMAETDPTRFQSLMEKVRSPESKMGMAAALARTLASQDPAAAVALYDSLPASRSRSMVALELATAWSKRDPEAALAWVQAKLSEGDLRRVALAIALTPFADSDPKRVLALLGPGNDGNADYVSFNSYSTELGGLTFGEGTAASRIEPNSIRERAFLKLVESSPGEAAALLNQELAAISSSTRGLSSDMTQLVLKATGMWLKSDPAAAIAWMNSQEGQTREALFSRVSSYLDLTPESARKCLAALGSFGDGSNAYYFMLALAPTLAKADAAGAFATADTLPENLRASWIEAVISRVAQVDPAAAAKEVGRLPEKAQPMMNASIAKQIAHTSPQDAVAFLDTLPPEAKNATAYRDVIQPWIESAPQKAMDWWQSLPPGDSPARRGALPILAGRIYEADPSTAPAIIGVIEGFRTEPFRMEATGNLALSIAKTDPEAAYALIAKPELKLSESSQQSLKQRIESSLQKQ